METKPEVMHSNRLKSILQMKKLFFSTFTVGNEAKKKRKKQWSLEYESK